MDLHDIVSQIKRYYSEIGEVPSMVKFQKFFKISDRQLNKHGWVNLVKMAGLIPNQYNKTATSIRIEARKSRVLVLDIETSPMRGYIYGLFDQNISHKHIEKDWFIMSWACKFLDSDEIFYADSRDNEDVEDDKRICQQLRDLIASADIILGHNSDAFDIKKINARLIKHDIKPIPEMQTLDTLKIARRFFKFSSNKLDYIANYLGVGGKLHSQKFHGLDLSIAILNKNPEAFIDLEIYNKQDVVITEAVFKKLATFDHRINLQLYTQSHVCICGCEEFTKDGMRYTASGAFQRYKCKSCGKFFRSKENLVPNEIRKNLMK
jgi:DNA polymerase elongation subunit (family B)